MKTTIVIEPGFRRIHEDHRPCWCAWYNRNGLFDTSVHRWYSADNPDDAICGLLEIYPDIGSFEVIGRDEYNVRYNQLVQ